jgi:uncharacterized damage-inducible protein DinB
MTTKPRPEVWLRGPVPGIAPLLQPVAHGLMQCREEVTATLTRLTPAQIGARPSGAASVAFHVRHAAGSLDRLLTYARGEQLSRIQLGALSGEATEEMMAGDGPALVALFEAAIERALAQLGSTSEATLLDARGVGRAQLPSTVGGLLFHAAEHTQRHVGQMVTTARIVLGV